ncbi:MAG: ATP-binding protein [Janthinobacterium lividum]
MALTFDELWEQLQTADESVQLEAKRATEIGKSILETVCAFCNEPGLGGGYLLLGVVADEPTLFGDYGGYRVEGVAAPDKLQRDLASQCAQKFNMVVRPRVDVVRRDGKNVLVVFIAEVPAAQKPVYLENLGLPRGAFRRIGSSDQRFTAEDLAFIYQLRDGSSYDETPIASSNPSRDFAPAALTAYRQLRAKVSPAAAELADDDATLLQGLKATMAASDGSVCATVAGMLLFGTPKALGQYFPTTRVDYMRVNSRQWLGDAETRYENSLELRESLLTAIPRLIDHIMADLPTRFQLPDGSDQRRDVPLVPREAIREIVVNALMHRTYGPNSAVRGPLSIVRFSNRLEVQNPGYSLKPEDQLGERGSVPRNERVANVLHDLNLAETKGTGIGKVRADMRQANLSEPLFVSNRTANTFTATLLLHHLLDEENLRWLAQFRDCHLSDDEARALAVVRETGQINNANFRLLSGLDTTTVSRSLARLRDFNLLKQEGRGAATFYVPGMRFLASLATNTIVDKPQPTMAAIVDKPQPTMAAIVDKQDSAGYSLPADFPVMPRILVLAISQLGGRPRPDQVRIVIQALCDWRPLKMVEISALLKRNPHYISTNYIRLMLRDNELEYTHPEDLRHPQQAYRVPDSLRQTEP